MDDNNDFSSPIWNAKTEPVFAWAKRLGGTVDDEGRSFAIDSGNNILMAGYVQNAADLDGDGNTTGTNETSGYGDFDVFLTVFDSSGNFQWSER